MRLTVRVRAGTVSVAEAEYLDSLANKTPFSFRVGLNLPLPTALGMAVEFCPQSRWVQMCQSVLSR